MEALLQSALLFVIVSSTTSGVIRLQWVEGSKKAARVTRHNETVVSRFAPPHIASRRVLPGAESHAGVIRSSARP